MEGLDTVVTEDDCCSAENAGGWGSYSGDCVQCPDPTQRVTLEARLDQPQGNINLQEYRYNMISSIEDIVVETHL